MRALIGWSKGESTHQQGAGHLAPMHVVDQGAFQKGAPGVPRLSRPRRLDGLRDADAGHGHAVRRALPEEAIVRQGTGSHEEIERIESGKRYAHAHHHRRTAQARTAQAGV
jgi:hypothetical protein